MSADADVLRAVRAAAYENARPEVQALVPLAAARILDVGCSSGALGGALRARQGARVVGVEADRAYAADARERLDAVVEADLESWDPTTLGERFDCVVCADVLEHLRAPDEVLRRLVDVLEPGGHTVVSLPNVRYWETFWQLGVRGTWPRRSLGIFDRTHLRWFTLRDAWELVEEAGLRVERVERVLRLRPDRATGTAVARILGRTPARTFVTFQHVLLARHPG